MTEVAELPSILEIIELFRTKAFEGADYKGYTPTNPLDAIAKSDQANQDRLALLGNTLPIFDEFLGWFMSISDTLCVVVISSKGQKDKKWSALFIAVSVIVSQLIAVRRLVVSGLDLPAKQILRCLVEHIDLAVRLSLDHTMVIEFMQFDRLIGPKGAKAFWSKYVQKTRNSHLRERAYSQMEALLGKRATEYWKKIPIG